MTATREHIYHPDPQQGRRYLSEVARHIVMCPSCGNQLLLTPEEARVNPICFPCAMCKIEWRMDLERITTADVDMSVARVVKLWRQSLIRIKGQRQAPVWSDTADRAPTEAPDRR